MVASDQQAAGAAAGAGLQHAVAATGSFSAAGADKSPGATNCACSSSSSSSTSGAWHERLAGFFGGHAGLPVDGWLTTCCSQIGQIMLVLPNAFAKCGMAAALPLSLGCACLSFWTMWCLIGE